MVETETATGTGSGAGTGSRRGRRREAGRQGGTKAGRGGRQRGRQGGREGRREGGKEGGREVWPKQKSWLRPCPAFHASLMHLFILVIFLELVVLPQVYVQSTFSISTSFTLIGVVRDFSYEELTIALKHLRHGKAPGLDNIHAEFLLLAGDHAKEWLRKFFNKCLQTCKLPRIWRRATVIAILKPNKPKDEPRATGRFHCYAFHTRSWNA